MRITTASLQAKARSALYDRATRVEFAALGWANRDGHAQFSKGALAEILSLAGKPATAQKVSDAIRHAKERGSIGAESRSRCLVLVHCDADQGKGKLGCYEHGLVHV